MQGEWVDQSCARESVSMSVTCCLQHTWGSTWCMRAGEVGSKQRKGTKRNSRQQRPRCMPPIAGNMFSSRARVHVTNRPKATKWSCNARAHYLTSGSFSLLRRKADTREPYKLYETKALYLTKLNVNSTTTSNHGAQNITDFAVNSYHGR